MSEFNFRHAREEEQVRVMLKIQQDKDKVCPFCWKNLEKYHPKPILKKGAWWWLSENAWPYKGARVHFIFFYKEHVKHISQINPSAFNELGELTSWVERIYSLKGYALFIRSGRMEETGSSVQHIHAQLIAGSSQQGPDSEALKIKLGYRKKD